MTTGRINQVTFSSARANNSRATPRILFDAREHMDSQTPNQSRVGATHTNRRNGGGNAILTLAPVGASKHQSGHVENFNMHRSVHISKEIFLCSRRCGSDSSKKGRTRCHRQSAPYPRYLTRSATNVAHRALVISISTPSGEEKSTQCTIFHDEIAPQVIKSQHVIQPRQRGENGHAAQSAGGKQSKAEM